MRQRISQYAQVLYVMAKKDVQPENAKDWLSKSEHVGGKKVSGIAKGLRLYSRLTCVQERNKLDRDRKCAERAREVERIMKKLEKKLIAEIAGCRSLAVYKGQPLVLLGRVEMTLAQGSGVVTNDNADIYAIANRHLRLAE